MKRPYLSLALMTLAAALLSGYAAWGQPRPAPQAACCPAACPLPPVCAPVPPARCCTPQSPDNGKLVEELLAILKETSSPDTFLVTVRALAVAGPDARAAVPAVIRSADRLGLFKDIMKQCKEEGPGLMVVEAIEQMLHGGHVVGACCYSGRGGIAVAPCVPAPPPFMVPCCPPGMTVPFGAVTGALIGSMPPQAPRPPAPAMPPAHDE